MSKIIVEIDAPEYQKELTSTVILNLLAGSQKLGTRISVHTLTPAEAEAELIEQTDELIAQAEEQSKKDDEEFIKAHPEVPVVNVPKVVDVQSEASTEQSS